MIDDGQQRARCPRADALEAQTAHQPMMLDGSLRVHAAAVAIAFKYYYYYYYYVLLAPSCWERPVLPDRLIA